MRTATGPAQFGLTQSCPTSACAESLPAMAARVVKSARDECQHLYVLWTSDTRSLALTITVSPTAPSAFVLESMQSGTRWGVPCWRTGTLKRRQALALPAEIDRIHVWRMN